MVNDVLTLNKLHVVDFTCCLHPFEAVFVREAITASQCLVATLYKSIFGQDGIVSKSDEALAGKRWQLSLSAYLVTIENGRIKISFIVIAIPSSDIKDGILARSPLQVGTIPAMLFTVTLADAFKPGIKRLVMELDRVISCRLELV